MYIYMKTADTHTQFGPLRVHFVRASPSLVKVRSHVNTFSLACLLSLASFLRGQDSRWNILDGILVHGGISMLPLYYPFFNAVCVCSCVEYLLTCT